MYDIISIGDATLDTFIQIDDATLSCELNKENCLMCLSYGKKIPIHNFERTVAGEAANNAVASSRLGLQAAFWTILGQDETGQMVIDEMTKEGVATKYVEILKGSKSNFSIVLNFKGERTQLIYRYPREYKLPKLDQTKWLYLTALSKEHILVNQPIIDYVTKNKVNLAYNPGSEQISCMLPGCHKLFKYTKILFANKEEAQAILGDEEKDIKKLLLGLHNLGPEIPVITDGMNGSYAYQDGKYYFIAAYPANLVEQTGAGDSYAAAFTAATFYNEKIPEAMRWGAINSASVVEKVGPQAGLLKLADLKAKLGKNPEFQAKEI